MSVQRRKGQSCIVYPQKLTIDRRGGETYAVDLAKPIHLKAAFIPIRAARAEVPGQQQIVTYRMILDEDLPDVGLFSRVTWRGVDWDVVAPPEYHHGTRLTKHWSMDLRQRPEINNG